MANILQERYGKLVNARLQQVLVTKDNVIFNNYYEGNPVAGAVKIPTRGEVTVTDYDKANGINGTQSSTTYVTLNIDQDKAINEVIDGYDAQAVPDGIVADRLDRASYGLANDMDKKSLAILEKGATKLDTTNALTKTTAYETVVDVSAKMTRAGVPNDGRRYLIVSPETKALLMKSSDFVKASDLGQEIIMSGAFGQIAGFNLYESGNMMYENTEFTATKKTTTDFIAGHPDYATRVAEFSVPVHVQDLNGSGNYIGACAVQGRQVWGAKVLEDKAIYLKVTEVNA